SCFLFCFFFFSSRRRHTRFSRDWSSEVCSSDLLHQQRVRHLIGAVAFPSCQLTLQDRVELLGIGLQYPVDQRRESRQMLLYDPRSEERRVGKECRSRRSP